MTASMGFDYPEAEVALIGGSGVYDEDAIEDAETVKVQTPYGPPSAPVTVGAYMGRRTAFLARHGPDHGLPPHRVPFRANLWALRELGVTRVLATNAVGSLQEEYAPGDLAVVDQFIDFTKQRDMTFYDGPRTVHIGTADPFCPECRDVMAGVLDEQGHPHHTEATVVVIEGPRFSTRAESEMFRDHADLINMTLCPEVQLARELDLCYASLATVTDYDVWRTDETVDTATVLKVIADNVEKSRKVLAETVRSLPGERGCACGETTRGAEI